MKVIKTFYIDDNWHTTWEKPNGERYTKTTHSKPRDYKKSPYEYGYPEYGYIDGNNHMFIQSYNQVCLSIYDSRSY